MRWRRLWERATGARRGPVAMLVRGLFVAIGRVVVEGGLSFVHGGVIG
jgi:hypothetical protein